VLSAEKLSKAVNGPDGVLTILDDVSLSVEHGASLAIIGASGSGKTTLLGLLAGLDRPSSGTVSLAGESLDTLDEEARARVRRRMVGFVFQSFHLLPALNAEENVMLPLELEGRDDARERAASALADVGLGKRLHHYPHQLSGGEQQRVAVARALINNPGVILADEPSGNLDTHNAKELHNLFFRLRTEMQQTFIIVTHNEDLANMADRKIVMQDGKMV